MINPDEAAESVAGFRWRHDRCRDWNRAASDGVSTHERLQRIAAAIVRRYATYAIGVEAVTAAPGVAPGWGTVAALGGGVVDLGVSMKIQTDMVMCLVALYADELSNAEKVEVALGIALTSSADQFACGAATTPVDDTAEIIDRCLSGPSLQPITPLFHKVVINAQKTAVAALPFGVGMGVSSAFNYALTVAVGGVARKVLTGVARLSRPIAPAGGSGHSWP